MQYRQTVILVFLVLLIASCTSSITHEVVQSDGAPFPDPYYVAQTTNPMPIRVSFFYSSVKMVEDLDGQKVPTIKFLDRRQNHYFMDGFEDHAKLVVRVNNPLNFRYKVLINRNIKYTEGGRFDMYTEYAYSDMKYREYTFDLPVSDEIKEVTQTTNLTDENGRLILSAGTFHYYVSYNTAQE